MTEYATETQAVEARTTDALRSIRGHWDSMMPKGPPPARMGGGGVAVGIVADHAAPTITADGRRYWTADHKPGGADVDATTRLVSLRREVQDTLNSWSRIVVTDRPVTKAIPAGRDVPGMCVFLERHAQWMSGHETAHDMADEVEALADQIDRLVSPRVKEWVSLGSCPIEIEKYEDGQLIQRECAGKVRARPRAAGATGEAEADCSRCGTTRTTSWWESMMFDDPEVRKMLTYSDIATLAHHLLGHAVPKDTVKKWARRGIITPSGERDNQGRVLFARDAVVYAVMTWKDAV